MVSEGVDIKRLRVLVYLPNALTELAFRQAVGRVVRTLGPDDDTRAYVVMPSTKIFECYARKVEQEMSPAARKIKVGPKTKKCPDCGTECKLSAKTCDGCGHEFPGVGGGFKTCSSCGALNPSQATSCQQCGEPFGTNFTLTLDEALRTGAIVRGMDLNETEVKEGEKIAGPVREKVLLSGDNNLIRIIKVLPDESFARLKDILSTSTK
jgi:superfamily II DNA or RNA helicase